MAYVSEQEVTGIFGPGWEGSGDATLAVMQANDWLTARGVPEVSDDRITRAGAYLARMAAQGALYADSDGAVKSERVKAEGVEVDTTYQDGAKSVAGDMQYALDLLRPYLKSLGNVALLRRI